MCHFLRFCDGACDKALAAADFSAFVDFGLASTLAAADAAFLPVCRGFLAITITSFRAVLRHSPERDVMQVSTPMQDILVLTASIT